MKDFAIGQFWLVGLTEISTHTKLDEKSYCQAQKFRSIVDSHNILPQQIWATAQGFLKSFRFKIDRNNANKILGDDDKHPGPPSLNSSLRRKVSRSKKHL